VATPAIVDPDLLADETALPTLLAGARGDFAAAFGGDASGDEGLILAGGLRADEFLNRDTFEERRDVDLGTMRTDNATLRDLFRNSQRARRAAEFAGRLYSQLGATQPGYAEVLNIAGYSTLLIGETFCPGIPFSDLDANQQIQPGQPLTRDQVFQRAIAKFDSAIAVATGTSAAATTQLNLARVGRGRALINLGRFAEARAAVTAVPTSFVYNVEYSENTARQNNGVFFFNNVNRRWGVANAEGGTGFDYVAAADPRVPTQTTTRNGLDGVGPRVVNQLKYPNRSASIPLASGTEARLIEAEAALQAGTPATTTQLLGALRSAAGLPALSTAGLSNTQLTDLLFRERAFWLFATGHRLGDMRRLLRAPYNRSYTSVYPQGSYFKGGRTYGDQPSLLLPLEEENNPNFNGCTAAN
jgi:hypothetical protein